MRIILDMDSILVNLMAGWLSEYNEKHGDDLTVDRILSWDTHLYAKAGEAIYDVLERPGFFRDLLPLPGAVEAVNALLDAGHEVFLVTAASFGANIPDKVDWVKRHLPRIDKRHLVFAHEKHLIEADVIVDDGPHNATAYRKAHPSALILTIGYPYNADSPAYNEVCGNWQDTESAWREILELIEDASAPPSTDRIRPAVARGWYGFDLDGTLAVYDHWRGETHVGKPISSMVRRVKKLLADGEDVRIFTARACNSDPAVREAIERWCKKYIGQVLPITNEKDYGLLELWDDRAIQVIPNTGLRADGEP